MNRIRIIVAGAVLIQGVDGFAADTGTRVDFAREIKPILAERCYECHGAQKQKASLRWDQKASPFAGGDSGQPAVFPGNSAASMLLQRVSSTDPKQVMPPKGAGLTPAQIALLKAWIDQGANWPDDGSAAQKKHWAYIKPERPPLPRLRQGEWPRNPIDAFILERLEQEGLKPAPEADRQTLLRRASLDLVGLPPTIQELDAFLADQTAGAWDKAVDRLLASPRYGERWARPWLDLARYADTQGYEKDNRRSQWPWRDWVIHALNRNLPFDQFTVEQIAGDLLPNATREQKVATGFHRNTMTNTEGGTDDEEYRHEAVVDRINTTMSVWMGTTFNCAQCHNHKNDPFTIKEYYRLLACLNSTADTDQPDERPTFRLPTPEQEARLKELRDGIAAKETEFNTTGAAFDAALAKWELSAKTNLAKVPTAISNLLTLSPGKRNDKQRKELAAHYRSVAPELKPLRDELARLRKEEKELDQAIPITAVMEELSKPRETHLHIRGSFLSKGEKVQPGAPAVLHPLPTNLPPRLALARWLVDTNNPLTARVIVNRLWESYFGIGIVETSQDFGSQGDLPSHPKLLDWLATEFMARQWDLKAMHKLIVTSATYRQSSRVTPDLQQRDPYNRLLARGPRVRLEAEMVRDQALAISGLLSPKLGGPPVMPPQPDGIWQIVYSGDKWVTSKSDDKYRRGLYTFWRRSSPYPSMITFDAPTREFCVIKRSRSNTPLQALTLLNDPVYVEAAQALAERMLSEGGTTIEQRIRHGFRLTTARNPRPEETKRLLSLYETELTRFKADTAAAEKLLSHRAVAQLPGTVLAEQAAWTIVANVLLNLDEVIAKG